MKTPRILGALGAAMFTIALVALAPGVRAQSTNALPNLTYYVTLNNLNALPIANGVFSLDFQLITGSGNVSNTVTLSNFVFTGGTASGTSAFTSGNESGSFSNSLVLSSLIGQGGQDNEFAEAFSAGVTQISFKVSVTPNDEIVNLGTVIPDQFNIAILDNGLANIPTTDLSGGNSLLSEAIASTNTIGSLALSSSTSPDAGVSVSAVPEPSTYALFGLGALVLLIVARRRTA